MRATVDLIERWAEDRGLFAAPDCKKQVLKCAEEFGETAAAIIKRKPLQEIADGIGDTGVTLILLARMEGMPVMMPVRPDGLGEGLSSTEAALRTMGYIGRLAEVLSRDSPGMRGMPFYQAWSSAWLSLFDLSRAVGTTLAVCLNAAYSEIAERKGQTVDGVFIKQDDMCGGLEGEGHV